MKNEPIITKESLLALKAEIQGEANALNTALVQAQGAMVIIDRLLADLEPQKEPNEKQVPWTKDAPPRKH
jgi:hypothetical protein